MNFDNHVSNKDEFRFSEITSLTGVKPYVLRFWESEFTEISPVLSSDGHKIYKQDDLALIEKIKDLLFNQKMSISEAKASLACDISEINTLKEQSVDLEKDIQVAEHVDAAMHASSVASRISLKKQWMQSNGFKEQDVVRLVQAKKKLTKILSDIDGIINDKGWS